MPVRSFAAIVAVLVLALPAFAQEAAPDSQGGRYRFSKATDGFVRLDTQTGEVALCSARSVGWACQVAAEDRTAYESEIARLRSENAALKGAILSHGLALPPGVMPEPPAGGNEITVRLPDDADLDRAMAFVNRVWRRLVEAISRAQHQVLDKT